MLNNKPSTEPLAQSCMLLSPEAPPSTAVCATHEELHSVQAIEPSAKQNSEPAGSHDFASQANGVADAKMQQYQHLPETVSAVVRQHKLQL